MTDERMALIELIEKQADSDLVREMLAFAADRIMELEVEAAHRRGEGRTLAAARGAAQRISGARLGHPCRADRAGDPEAAQGKLSSRASWSRAERPRRRSWR